jgi:CBS domain-containing protein
LNYEKLEAFFKEIKLNLDKGITPEKINVRMILDTLEVSRRGTNVNSIINELLDEYKLVIEPDFLWEYVYNDLEIKNRNSSSLDIEKLSRYRIDGLESANIPPVRVNPEEDLNKAITVMVANNYSQLPVMTNERDVKGVITWKSIASNLHFCNTKVKIKDFMDKPIIIDDDASMFDAIEQVSINDYVLIKSTKDNKIKGILTSSDLSRQFKNLAEPFLLIGKCELLIRKIIYGKYSKDELESVKNPNDINRKITSIHDLSFGEYIRLIEKEERWEKLELNLDRKYIIKKIKGIKEIRNDVMHFDPNGIDEKQIEEIKSLNNMFEQVLKSRGTV